MTNQKKLFLIDGFALIYKAYFSFINSPKINPKGINTSIIFGFINILHSILQKQKPTHCAFVFDAEGHEDQPEDLQKCMSYIEKIIEGFNIQSIKIDGLQANTIIGTLSKKASECDFEIYISASDQLYGQLVSKHIFLYVSNSIIGQAEILGTAEIHKKYEIKSCRQIIDLISITGDTANNIPGIKGIDEKTANKLINEFISVDGLYRSTNKLTGKLKQKIEEGEETIRLSKTMATIITDASIEFEENKLELKEWNLPALRELLAELELYQLGEKLFGAMPIIEKTKKRKNNVFAFEEIQNIKPTPVIIGETVIRSSSELPTSGSGLPSSLKDIPHQYFNVATAAWRKELLAELLQQPEIAIDTETTSLDVLSAEIVGISFCYKAAQAFYIALPPDFETAKSILAEFNPIFESDTILKIGQNIKYDMHILKNYDCHISGPIYDTMLAHYVFEPEQRHGMDALSETFSHYKPIPTAALIGPKGKSQQSMRDIAIETVAEYCNEDTDVTFRLKHVFVPKVKNVKTENILHDIELPLIPILCEMERAGIRVDEPFLAKYSIKLKKEADDHEAAVYQLAGEKFNLASPKQLGEVLFDRMKLDPMARKTKSGQYATGEEVLTKLADEHQIVKDILEFRQLAKLRSTYVDAIPPLINANTGRLHTTFQQAIAVTGRLSSTHPNLQNIPVKTPRGKEMRRAFIARDADHVIVSADYSQIELRIIAAASGDVNMCESFKAGIDIHAATAAKVFGITTDQVTPEMRYKAKSVNFGIIYGQGAFGLAESLKISRAEAKQLIDNYWLQYGSVRSYMDNQIIFAQEHGYAQTFMGRKQWLPGINSASFPIKAFAERNAINMPIQGSAADMIKLAMIKIDVAIKAAGLKSKMVLQVHDELVFDALKEELDALKPIIIECMQTAMPLPNEVPVIAQIGIGNNWLEAH